MICSKCAKDNKEGSKFCEGCGSPLAVAPASAPTPGYGAAPTGAPAPGYGAAPTGAPAPGYGAAPTGAPTPGYGAAPTGAPAPGYGAAPTGAPTPGYGAAPTGAPGYGYPPVRPKKPSNIDIGGTVNGIIADVKGANKRVFTKALSVLLAVLTVLTMMMGWVKNVDEYDIGDDEVKVKDTYNVLQFRRDISLANKQIQESLDEADDPSKKQEKEGTKYFIVNLLMFLVTAVAFIAILALAAYIFLAMLGSKGSSLVGMLASIISVAAAILFIICLLILDEKDLDMTLGLFASIIAAAGNFVLMFVKKNELKA